MRIRLVLILAAATLLAPMGSCSDSSIGPGEEEMQEPEPYSHVRAPGASANDFLAGSNFADLVVELDYMPGHAPNAEAVDSLQAFLEQRLHKTVAIQSPTEVPSGQDSIYTAGEIRALEEEHRDTYTDSANANTLAAYMLIVDGRFDQANVLGIAYYNTSSAFFGAAYDEITGGIGQPSRYQAEATSFRHEFGHLFGLVAIEGSGTDMQTEHHDEANGHHCDNDQCLMYYAMESTDLFGSFFEDEIPALDANCMADLQANGGR